MPLINSIRNIIPAIRAGVDSGISLVNAVLYYKPNPTEAAGDRIKDYSQEGNTGNLHSGVGLSFDGVNDQLQWTQDTFAGDFTIQIWLSNAASTNIILTQNGGLTNHIRLYSNKVEVRIAGTIYSVGSGNYADGSKIHVAIVRSGSTLYLYKNGVLDGSVGGAVGTFTIGENYFSAAWTCYGYIAKSEALSASEILQFAQYPETKPSASNLVRWFSLDHGAGAIAYDGAGTGHATIAGATWVTGVSGVIPQTALMSWNKRDPGSGTVVLLPEGLTSDYDILGVVISNTREPNTFNLSGNAYAQAPDDASLDVTTKFSFAVWIYHDGSNDNGIFGRWHTTANKRAISLITLTGNKVQALISNDGSTTDTLDSSAMSLGWNHVGVSFNAGSLKIYHNGVLDTSKTSAITSIYVSDQPYEIGRYNDDASKQITTQIAMHPLCNEEISADVFLNNFNAERSTYGL